ncbi:hypothetical protein [Nocardiopsis eucommiae]
MSRHHVMWRARPGDLGEEAPMPEDVCSDRAHNTSDRTCDGIGDPSVA